jgi:hypothetical protein
MFVGYLLYVLESKYTYVINSKYLSNEDFWRDRVYNSPNVTGSYNKYDAKLPDALKSPAIKTANSTAWAWQLAGNQNLVTHNRGLINSLWINPSNIDEIYAGSNTSGLFRTLNGGASLECVILCKIRIISHIDSF